MLCDVQTQETSARCFGCIPKGARKEVWIYLLCKIAGPGLVTCKNPGAVVLADPTGIISGGFNLSWSADPIATGYKIDIATDAGFASLVTGYNGLDVGNVTTYRALGLVGNVQYFIRIRAYQKTCIGPASNTAIVTTAQIQWLPVTATVTWTDGNGAHGAANLAAFQATADYATVTIMGSSFGTMTSLVDISGLPTIANLNLSSNASLTLVNLTGVRSLTTALAVNNCASLTTLTAPDLTNIGGAAGPVFTGCTSLTAINFPLLTTTATIQASSLTALTSISCPVWTAATSGITIGSNAALTTVNFALLASAGNSLSVTSNTALTSLTLSSLGTVTGVLTITGNTNAAFLTISLPALTIVTGAITMTGNTNLTTISMPVLSTCASIAANALNSVTSISLAALTTVTGSITLGGNSLASLSLPLLASAGSVIISGTAMTSLSMPLLTMAATGALDLSSLLNLNSVTLTSLQTVNATFSMGSTVITEVLLPALTSIGGAFNWSGMSKLHHISAPNLVTIGTNLTLQFSGNGAVGGSPVYQFDFSSLTTVGGSLNMGGCTTVASILLPVLNSVASGITISGSTTLTTLSIPLLTTCGNTSTCAISGCTGMTTLNLASFVTCQAVTMNGNTALATLSFGAWVPKIGGYTFTWNGDALPAATINSLLAQCVAVGPGLINTTGDMQGGTNAAPTGQGIIDKGTLNLQPGNSFLTN